MKEMVQKYEDIQAKVFDARSTLKETTEALERQTKLTRDVIDLRERTQRAALKVNHIYQGSLKAYAGYEVRC